MMRNKIIVSTSALTTFFYSRRSFGSNVVAETKAETASTIAVTNSTRPIPCRDGTLVFPFALPPRELHLSKMKDEVYDVLVIGGGCVGAGVAHDASLRGLKVALVEADDFSSGTSGRSTKLIHGGVRYLENAFWHLDIGEYRLVKEALEERSHMLHAAPHMARALPIMVPLEKWWQIPYYWLGGKVYDWVAGKDRHVPPSSFIGKEQALYAFPMLNPDSLKGAIVYYDGQMNDTRYGLSIVMTAVQSGANVLNYCRVKDLVANSKGNISGADVEDLLTGQTFSIRAKSVINCTGPFTDSIRKMAANAVKKSKGEPIEEEEAGKKFENLVSPAGGIHVVLPDHFSPEQMGLIVPETSDGRVLFFLPWEGGTLCGTTDSKSDLTMLPRPSIKEIDFVLAESGKYLNKKIHRSDIRAAWSGIRPLVRDLSKKDTASISREHVVEVSAGNMVTVVGGKWTTYRRMAEDAINKMLSLKPGLKQRADVCKTGDAMLIGADRARIVCDQRFDIIQITLREQYNFDRDVAAHLMRNYGTRSLQIAELVQAGYLTRGPGLHPKRLVGKHPILEAEIVFCVEQEYCCTAIDFLARRTRLAFLDHKAAVEALPLVIDLMSKLLNWDKARQQKEFKEAQVFLDTMMVPLEMKSDGKDDDE